MDGVVFVWAVYIYTYIMYICLICTYGSDTYVHKCSRRRFAEKERARDPTDGLPLDRLSKG